MILLMVCKLKPIAECALHMQYPLNIPLYLKGSEYPNHVFFIYGRTMLVILAPLSLSLFVPFVTKITQKQLDPFQLNIHPNYVLAHPLPSTNMCSLFIHLRMAKTNNYTTVCKEADWACKHMCQ